MAPILKLLQGHRPVFTEPKFLRLKACYGRQMTVQSGYEELLVGFE